MNWNSAFLMNSQAMRIQLVHRKIQSNFLDKFFSVQLLSQYAHEQDTPPVMSAIPWSGPKLQPGNPT